MDDFKTIETQEELDAIIGKRLAQKEKVMKEQYADYDEIKAQQADYLKQIESLNKSLEEANKRVADHDAIVADLNGKIANYETASAKTRLAIKYNLPLEMADRIGGDTEEAMDADAKMLAGFVARVERHAIPLADTEEPVGDNKKAEFRKLASNLKNKGD